MFQPSSNVNQKTSIVHFYLANKADIIYRFSKDYYVKIRLSHKDKKFLVVFVKKKILKLNVHAFRICRSCPHLHTLDHSDHARPFPYNGDGNGRVLTINVRSQNVILELWGGALTPSHFAR